MGAQHDQADCTTRFEWSAEGIRHVAPGSASVVIVDVLRFSTAVDIAVANGAEVYPYQHAAAAFAQSIGGHLANGSPYSLSPASLTSIPTGTRLVLPSPKGGRWRSSPPRAACRTSSPAVCATPRPSLAPSAGSAAR